jgi:hypothetical protein
MLSRVGSLAVACSLLRKSESDSLPGLPMHLDEIVVGLELVSYYMIVYYSALNMQNVASLSTMLPLTDLCLGMSGEPLTTLIHSLPHLKLVKIITSYDWQAYYALTTDHSSSTPTIFRMLLNL